MGLQRISLPLLLQSGNKLDLELQLALTTLVNSPKGIKRRISVFTGYGERAVLVNSHLYGTGPTDYGTTTGFPTLVAPVHAFGFAPGSGTETGCASPAFTPPAHFSREIHW